MKTTGGGGFLIKNISSIDVNINLKSGLRMSYKSVFLIAC